MLAGHPIFNISNSLSFLRLLLSIPLSISIVNANYLLFWITLVIAVLSDYLDGYFARRLNQITEFGKIIDPLADKIIIGVAVVVLYQCNYVSLEYFIAILARDILIFLGGIFITMKYKIILQSNMLGKVTVNFIGLSLLLSFRKYEYSYIFIFIGTFFIAASFLFYLINAYKLVSMQKQKI